MFNQVPYFALRKRKGREGRERKGTIWVNPWKRNRHSLKESSSSLLSSHFMKRRITENNANQEGEKERERENVEDPFRLKCDMKFNLFALFARSFPEHFSLSLSLPLFGTLIKWWSFLLFIQFFCWVKVWRCFPLLTFKRNYLMDREERDQIMSSVWMNLSSHTTHRLIQSDFLLQSSFLSLNTQGRKCMEIVIQVWLWWWCLYQDKLFTITITVKVRKKEERHFSSSGRSHLLLWSFKK